MRNRLASLISLFVGALIVCWAVRASAYDQQITSTMWAEGYSVYTPDGEQIRRRRFVEDLYLGAWNLLPQSSDPYYRGPRLSIELQLRLDTDFGVTRPESSPSSELQYIPGVTPVAMDAMFANVHVEGLWNGVLSARAGRQIRIDTLRFCAFDGLEIRLKLPLHINWDMYIGYEVRGGQLLGYDALELDGTDSGGRHDLEADRFPSRTDPKSRLALGTEMTIHPRHWIEMAVAYRATGLSQPLADARAGGRLFISAGPIDLEGSAIWNVLLDSITDVDAVVAFRLSEATDGFLEYTYFRPSFEGDSIFNVFDFANHNDLGARVETEFSEVWKGSVWMYTRLTDDDATLGARESDIPISGLGGGLGGRYFTSVREFSVRLSALQEWGESRIGGELSLGRSVLRGRRLMLRLRCSVWHIDDLFSERLSGNLAGYVLSARFRIADGAHLLGEFEHYIGGPDMGRFLALAMLQLDLWR